MNFVRKNLITINARFVPPGTNNCVGVGGYSTVPPSPPAPVVIPPQPTSASCTLEFPSPSGAQVTQTLPMTLGSDGITWSCQWDSSACGPGTSQVSWVVYGSGVVQAAAQGQFTVIANPVNTF